MVIYPDTRLIHDEDLGGTNSESNRLCLRQDPCVFDKDVENALREAGMYTYLTLLVHNFFFTIMWKFCTLNCCGVLC